ncbi:MAG: M23 family metallopeptidase [Phormidesmis sp.]
MAFRILFSFILSVALTFCAASPSFAQSADQILTTSFDQMPPYSEAGAVPDIGEEAGYNTGREWAAGDRPSDVVKLGDVETGLGAEELSLTQIAELTGLDLSKLNVANLDFLQGVSVEEFLQDVPFLSEWNVQDIPEFEQLGGLGGIFTGDRTLGEVLEQTPEIADLEVTDVFGEMPVDSIPNLESAQLSDFEGIGDKTISEVPGLGSVSLESFPIPVSMPSLNLFPRQDIAFGPKEYSGGKSTPQPVSGGTNGTQLWRPNACSGGCAHIELADSGWEGANWMTNAHRVKDGFGFLGSIIDEAGAYRIPFGPAFALQVTGTDEKTGEADWGLAFRVCKRGFIDLGCTAYFMEVPLGVTTKEGDNILTGVRDGLGGSSVPMDAPPEFEAMRPETPSELQAQIDAKIPPSSSSGFSNLCGDGPGGVKMEALAEAFHKIESQGGGDYGAVGIFVSLSPGETGRGLGKYQYMSYREDVVAKIGSTPEGQALLAKARSGQPLSANEVIAVFPPEDQDSLFAEDQKRNIETLLSKGFEGERIIEVLGQMHLRGSGVLTNGDLDSATARDGNGTSVKEYGEKFLGHYRNASAKTPDEDASTRCASTGTYINPSASGIKSFSRRFSSGNVYNPVTGTYRRHDGDDLAVGQGSDIVASDGGIVEWRSQCDLGPDCGYGWYMLVHHDDGNATLYAHLSNRIAPDGSRVKQGEVIAKSGGDEFTKGSGGSTGPHLHFEVRMGGTTPVPPETLVDYNKTVADLKSPAKPGLRGKR